MGVSVEGGGGSRDVNVEINIIPFIDLMSVLAAFLLITAAWSNVKQMPIKPKGIGKDAEAEMPEDPPVRISLLVAQDSLWVGLTTGDLRQIKKTGEEYDYAELSTILKEYKQNSTYFTDREDIEIAAEDGVQYQAIITTMDYAIAAEFKDVGFVDPNSLSVRFKQ